MSELARVHLSKSAPDAYKALAAFSKTVGGIADLARLAEVRTRVLAVAIDDDRTMPAAAVDRLADQLDVPVVRVDVATGAKPDAHLRWVAASPGHVVTAIEAWAAGSVG